MINFADPSAFARGHFIEKLRSFPEEADMEVLRPSDGVTLGHTSAGSAHTSDIGQALRAMRRIGAGTVWINRYGRSRDLIIPTGGFKGSGVGKDLGRQAFEAAQREKSVLMDFEGRSANES